MTDETRGALPDARRTRLLETLHREGSVRVNDLAGMLGVTSVTVRRDVAQLAAEGLVRRVHGGVTLPDAGATNGAMNGAGNRATNGAGSGGPATGIGMLVPSLDYYWPDVVRGAEEAARRAGLRVTLRGSSYESEDDLAHVEHLVRGARVAGLMLATNTAAGQASAVLEHLVATRTPAVLVERRVPDALIVPPLDSVVSDHALGAAMAVNHLVGLGHRRIGLVTSRNSPTSTPVRRGWLDALVTHDLDDEGALDAVVDRSATQVFDPPIDNIVSLALERGVTALVVHADPEAIAVVQQCHMRGLSVPGDLSIVAYDDEVAELFSPALTAIRPPRRSVGHAAVELLAARLADPDRPSHRVIITPTLHVRESTGRVRGS